MEEKIRAYLQSKLPQAQHLELSNFRRPLFRRMDGEVGYGIIEYGVSRGYPRYQEIQHLPPF